MHLTMLQCFVILLLIKSLPRIHCMHSILAGQSCQTSIHELEVICIMTSFARRMHGQCEGFIAKTSTMKHAITTFGWLQKKNEAGYY